MSLARYGVLMLSSAGPKLQVDLMLGIDDVIAVFERESWEYFQIRGAPKIVTAFRDSHDRVILSAQWPLA